MRPPFAGLFVAAIVLIADHLTKWYVVGPLALPASGPIELAPIFRLVFVENHGVSMGFFRAGSDAERWFLTAVTIGIAIGVGIWLFRERKLFEALALGAILGGAIGNIADRVKLGYVVDFLNLHFGAWSPFLVFNVADAAISIGVALLVIRALFFAPRALPEK
ncbi:signal peptidase II [Sphingomonas vulcanisoli]|uniref:Lipoprotein signal peptidase n=1 Tax=Sphingomonas vulcanisoli TaxID=1658060 RepID=A0ABX0TV45_9SPHN|nr:signal peptidase II [Sphingomonas vulcanisoli]NIJ08898.1 signal peptidase II [Sphingomonas vulcanisoli]